MVGDCQEVLQGLPEGLLLGVRPPTLNFIPHALHVEKVVDLLHAVTHCPVSHSFRRSMDYQGLH
eukprot:scaffold388869_cov47-Prasinocladus_malaysianus.AAC.4